MPTRRAPLGGLSILPIELIDVILMLALTNKRLLRGVCRTIRDFVDARAGSLTITVLQADKRRSKRQSVMQLTTAATRFPALHTLTIGSRNDPRKCLEGKPYRAACAN